MRKWIDCTNDPCILKKVFTVMKTLDKGKRMSIQTSKNTGDYKKRIAEMVGKIENQDFLMKIYYFVKAFIDE